MSMSPNDWARVTGLFDELATRSPDERAERLSGLASTDPALAAEVASLLESDANDGFLEDAPVKGLAAALMPSPRLLGQTIGAYRVEREIGRGGMGVVYEGRHTDSTLVKRVAIKTLAIGLDRPELVWRFRREQRILARLEHPNIATLFDGGTMSDGIPYLVMEYVDGVRIDQWCDQRRLTIAQRLDLFRQVCGAVEYAHAKLIVHRDLKPGNVLVTHDGAVKLLDFGIASLATVDDERSGGDPEKTRTGSAPFTTAYASPEQIRGGEVTTVSDVYSLGVLLHKLLTGRAPTERDAATGMARDGALFATTHVPSESVTAEQPVRCQVANVRVLREMLRGELDAIVRMALREEPSRRYPSAAALSADLHRYLRGMPVGARPDTLAYRVTKFVRRQRALVGAVAVAIFALVGGSVASLLSAQKAREEADRTRKLASVLQGMVGAGASTSYREIPTLLTVLDSARASIGREFAAEPRVRADAYALFGFSYFNFERPDLALMLFDSARVLHGSTVGQASVEVARDLAFSAAPLMALGQTDSAMARQRRAVDHLRIIKPRPDADLAVAEIELGFLEIALLSRPDSGLPRLAIALPLARRVPTPNWDHIAMGEAVTIMPFVNLQQPVRAESAYARAMEALARDSSSSHSRRSALGFAGQSLLLRGRPAEAEPVIRQLLQATELRLGASHYLTAQAQNLLAKVMLSLGRHDEGRVLIDSAIANNLAATTRDPMYLSEMYLTRARLAIPRQAWADAEYSIAESSKQLQRMAPQQRPIQDVSIALTRGLLLEARGWTSAARQAFEYAATTARASLPTGAANRARAESELAAFSARHK